MTDETAGRGPVPMVWAFVVREAAEGPPYADAIVQVDEATHELLLEDAYISGFTVTAGEPPPSTAVVHVHTEAGSGEPPAGGRLTRIILGDGDAWEPVPAPEVSPGWLSAAQEREGVVMTVVPPGTWPSDLPDREPDESAEILRAGLDRVRASALALHGMAMLNRDSTAHSASPQPPPG